MWVFKWFELNYQKKERGVDYMLERTWLVYKLSGSCHENERTARLFVISHFFYFLRKGTRWIKRCITFFTNPDICICAKTLVAQ